MYITIATTLQLYTKELSTPYPLSYPTSLAQSVYLHQAKKAVNFSWPLSSMNPLNASPLQHGILYKAQKRQLI